MNSGAPAAFVVSLSNHAGVARRPTFTPWHPLNAPQIYPPPSTPCENTAIPRASRDHDEWSAGEIGRWGVDPVGSGTGSRGGAILPPGRPQGSHLSAAGCAFTWGALR